MPKTYMQRTVSLYNAKVADEDIPTCPFCGSRPALGPQRLTVSCPNVECGIGSWWLSIEEWCTRTQSSVKLEQIRLPREPQYMEIHMDIQ